MALLALAIVMAVLTIPTAILEHEAASLFFAAISVSCIAVAWRESI